MSGEVIDGEFVEGRIVACPKCGRGNRVYKRSSAGVYRCGACRAALGTSFASRPRGTAIRKWGIIAGSIVGLFIVFAIIAAFALKSRSTGDQSDVRDAAARDARIDRPISEIGTFPPIPKPSSHASTPAALPQSPLALAAFTPLPRYSLEPETSPRAEVPTFVPENNQILFDAYPDSRFRGELAVDNGTSSDAVAKLIDVQTDRKVLSFVIGARQKATIHAIPDGTYQLLFAFGDQLYVGSDRFHKPYGFAKFVRPLDYEPKVEEDDSGRTFHSSEQSVTLYPVFAGNAKTSPISQKDFERY